MASRQLCGYVPSKIEQWSYIKFAFLYGRNASECHAKLREALSDRALPYRTVAHLVEGFKRGRLATVDLPHSGCPESAYRGASGCY